MCTHVYTKTPIENKRKSWMKPNKYWLLFASWRFRLCTFFMHKPNMNEFSVFLFVFGLSKVYVLCSAVSDSGFSNWMPFVGLDCCASCVCVCVSLWVWACRSPPSVFLKRTQPPLNCRTRGRYMRSVAVFCFCFIHKSDLFERINFH